MNTGTACAYADAVHLWVSCTSSLVLLAALEIQNGSRSMAPRCPGVFQLRSNPLTCLGTPTYAMVAMPAVLASFSLICVAWCRCEVTALLWCGHLRRSEGLGVHSMRPVWFCTWPRSSSACYSLILVLARVGWRGGPGRVRIRRVGCSVRTYVPAPSLDGRRGRIRGWPAPLCRRCVKGGLHPGSGWIVSALLIPWCHPFGWESLFCAGA